MSLPKAFLDELRERAPISTVVGRRVSWDKRKSQPAKGDYWACCPFHGEKTPSFHVDDRKGYYHCFGCHASGDAITFLRELDGMSFMEAVTELASIAGLELPAQDPRAAEKAERAKDLADWMEAAQVFFRTAMRGARGAAARRYLDGRGLSAQAVERFELGVAPPERRALHDHLIEKGAPAAALAEAGLIGLPEGGGQPYDRFRDRLMFPIRDGRGRLIAFGGRILGDGQPKYLNSPETPLFSKSRVLYNLASARAAAAKSGQLILAEGYMDVIALHEGGFAHAVAPLGTAVTEAQLQLAWRMADEPIVALDGDEAGQRAALRIADLALPLLSPGKSLRFALMPQGRDPDDVIRNEGAAAMEGLLARAEPMVEVLWRREAGRGGFDTPERRAALDANLRKLAGEIRDEGVRRHYLDALRTRRDALFRPAAKPGGGRGDRRALRRGGRFEPGPAMPSPETRASLIASAPEGQGRAREAAALIALWRHPDLCETHGEEIAALDFAQADLAALRDALTAAWLSGAQGPEAFRKAVAGRLGGDPTTTLRAALPPRGYWRESAPQAEVAAGLRETLDRLRAEAALRREVAEAISDDAPGAETDRRLSGAVEIAAREGRGRFEEDMGDDTPIDVDHYLASLRGRK